MAPLNTHERMNHFFANATPENYPEEKQKLINEGFKEASQLPEVYIPSVQQRGLIGTATGAQQMEMIKNQAVMQNAKGS